MSATIDTNTDLFDLAAVAASAEDMLPSTPPRPMDIDSDEGLVCPPAPRRRPLTPSEDAENAAYDAVVRQLALPAQLEGSDPSLREGVNELTVHLDTPPLLSENRMPSVEGLVSPSGLQRQQAVDSTAAPVCSPRLMTASPAEVFCVGSGVAGDTLVLDSNTSSPLLRRATDIEGDLSAADTNTSELSSADEAEADEVEHVPVDDTNTGGMFIGLRRQKHTGALALSLEAPVWMWGAAIVAVTAYLWMVVFLLKR